jgi:uncharacterized membrane protein
VPILAGFYFLAGISPPFLVDISMYGIAGKVAVIYRHFCHQIPERSFVIGGVPMAFCCRCTGFYGSLFLTPVIVAIRPSLSHVKFLLALALTAPAVLDFAGEFTPLTGLGNLLRLTTGLSAGLGLVWYVYPRIVAAIDR